MHHKHGVRITKVVPDDEAYRCGLRVGDVITHVGGLLAVHHRDLILQVNAATRCNANISIRKTADWRKTRDCDVSKSHVERPYGFMRKERGLFGFN